MLKAKHHFFIYPFFKLYTKWILRRNFYKVSFDGKYSDNGLATLLICNHISWWDGFWCLYFNMKVCKKKFHFMMLENQLRKHWYFNYTGGFSINKTKRSMLESLQYTSKLLADKKNLVLIFPQGKIQSQHSKQFQFEQGINRIIADNKGLIQIVFVANFTEYLSQAKASVFIHFESYEANANTSIEEAYNSFYASCLNKQLKLQEL